MSAWHFTLLGYKLALARPLWLVGLVVAVALGGLGLARGVLRRRALKRHLDQRLHEALAPGVSTVRPALRSVFSGLALGCFAFALAQPQCGERAEMVKRRGLDVVVAIDASRSMYARDVPPSRLERAKLELSTLLDSLKGDRVAVVAFSGDAFVQCPLTSDYSAAKMFLRAIDPEAMPQGGTNIGAALLLARKVFDSADRGAKDRVVVLLSDGEDLTGEIDEGLRALEEVGARVLAVGIGSDEGEPIPIMNTRGEVVGYKKDKNGVTVITRLDRGGLQRIVEATGGTLFHEPKGVAMAEVVDIIDSLQKAELESRLMMRYGEAYQPFLAVGLAWLFLATITFPLVEVAAMVSALFVMLALGAGPFERNHPLVAEGMEAYEAGDYDTAIARFRSAAEERPDDPVVQYNLADALFKAGKNDEANEALSRAESLDRTGQLRSRIHYNRGTMLAAQGKREEALKELRLSLRKDPSNAEARHNYEVLLRDLPPPPPPQPDGGTGDGGADGGARDGGADGGQGDAGAQDGGNADAGGSADAGQGGDGGQGDGGSQSPSDGGRASDGGQSGSDAGRPQDGGSDQDGGPSDSQSEPVELLDGGLSAQEAKRLLDSLKLNERSRPMIFDRTKTKRNDTHGKDW